MAVKQDKQRRHLPTSCLEPELLAIIVALAKADARRDHAASRNPDTRNGD